MPDDAELILFLMAVDYRTTVGPDGITPASTWRMVDGSPFTAEQHALMAHATPANVRSAIGLLRGDLDLDYPPDHPVHQWIKDGILDPTDGADP